MWLLICDAGNYQHFDFGLWEMLVSEHSSGTESGYLSLKFASRETFVYLPDEVRNCSIPKILVL